ncbi:dimethylamine monooxygenase subunit DmmA family protein [Lysinibacillus fusiformis]|nr:dimethylamine monooxygenase subunit DmmA family protein [Lysinibacillus fusiformis]
MLYLSSIPQTALKELEFPKNIKKVLIFVEEPFVIQQVDLLKDISRKVPNTLFHIKASSVSIELEEVLSENFSKLAAHISECTSSELTAYLQREKIGTHLLLIGPKEVVNDWEKTGTKVGFPVDAIHKFVLENNFKQVFCAKCYHKHKQRLNECNHCPNCLTQLSISDHFSKQHSAYLGYINLEE